MSENVEEETMRKATVARWLGHAPDQLEAPTGSTRREALSLMGAAAAAGVLSSGAALAAEETLTVVVGSTVPNDLILHVADLAGFFTEEQLKVDIVAVNNGAGQMSALLGGSADIGFVGITQGLRANAQGGGVMIAGRAFDIMALTIVVSTESYARIGITDDMPLQEKFSRLKGLTIGTTGPGSTIDALLRALLRTAGVDADTDVTIFSGNTPSLYAAVENKVIDAFLAGSPWREVAEVKGVGIPLFDPFKNEVAEMDGVLYKVVTTSKDAMASRPDRLLRAMRALNKATTYIHENPDKVSGLLRPRFPDMDQDVYELMIMRHIGGAPDQMLVTPEQFDRAMTYLTFAEGKQLDLTYDDVIDTSIVGQL